MKPANQARAGCRAARLQGEQGHGWRPYTGAGVYNTTLTTPAGITGGHYDHVHISVF